MLWLRNNIIVTSLKQNINTLPNYEKKSDLVVTGYEFHIFRTRASTTRSYRRSYV